MTLWQQQVKCADDDRWAFGPPIALPISPFVGLWVGAFRVSEIWVCQGPQNENCVRYEPVTAQHMDFILGTADYTASDAYEGWNSHGDPDEF